MSAAGARKPVAAWAAIVGPERVVMLGRPGAFERWLRAQAARLAKASAT